MTAKQMLGARGKKSTSLSFLLHALPGRAVAQHEFEQGSCRSLNSQLVRSFFASGTLDLNLSRPAVKQKTKGSITRTVL
jgi:hypothetical protein